jgi:cell fate (sporulation/competence/biofilm development) regulator YlbF (YheA/YmcA/DUF963 family)
LARKLKDKDPPAPTPSQRARFRALTDDEKEIELTELRGKSDDKVLQSAEAEVSLEEIQKLQNEEETLQRERGEPAEISQELEKALRDELEASKALSKNLEKAIQLTTKLEELNRGTRGQKQDAPQDAQNDHFGPTFA